MRLRLSVSYMCVVSCRQTEWHLKQSRSGGWHAIIKIVEENGKLKEVALEWRSGLSYPDRYFLDSISTLLERRIVV